MELICKDSDVKTPFYLKGVNCSGKKKLKKRRKKDNPDIICINDPNDQRHKYEWKCDETKLGFRCVEFTSADALEGRCVATPSKSITTGETIYDWSGI